MATEWIIDLDGRSGRQDLRRVMTVIAYSTLTREEREYLYAIGTRAAARVVLREARRRAPARTGQLRAAIQIEERLSRHRERYGQVVFGRAIVTVNAKRAPYWPYVEYGHNIVRGKKVFGRVRAYPFLRPALELTPDRQFRAAAQEMAIGFRRLKANQPDKTVRVDGPQLALPAPTPVLLLPPPR